jgi:cobalt-precorrin-5B (C1)-methyltransferase
MSERVREPGLRTGWTTGTCASAAAKAATIGLATGAAPMEVDVGLPSGARVVFPVEVEAPNRCVVVKDAGDDPDCTDGARMTATAQWHDPFELRAGPGIGTVTKPGLGLPVGAPAINPVPRRMIAAAVAEVTASPVALTFEVPGGEQMSTKTTNERLGIIGGISILGTSGVVRPFSTAAYRASVVQQVDVAAAQGETTIVLCTGSRSEQAALRLHPELDPVCVVEVGDFTGIALRRAVAAGMKRAVFVGMAGKITKLAAGVMMTHFHRSKVDGALLEDVARTSGASNAIVAAATETATARHFFEVCIAHGETAPLQLLAERAKLACEGHAELDVDVVLVDFDGDEVVARA